MESVPAQVVEYLRDAFMGLGRVGFAALLLGPAAACSPTSADTLTIDGNRALEHARKIVRQGPHPPGSQAQKEVGLYLFRELKSLGLEVRAQDFSPLTPAGRLEMANIWGILPGEQEKALVFASHYDSKLFHDFEFVGANDGAASSGVVLELARVLSNRNPTRYSLWFVFFDGEEAIRHWTPSDSLYGSRAFVELLRQEGRLPQVSALILLDLIGGQPLKLMREQNSSAWLSDLIWNAAARLGHDNIFLARGSTSVEDDHVPFLRAGVPAVDLIDLSYPHWHQPEDTIDKLSPQNMAIVGNVVLAALPEIEKYLEGGK